MDTNAKEDAESATLMESIRPASQSAKGDKYVGTLVPIHVLKTVLLVTIRLAKRYANILNAL